MDKESPRAVQALPSPPGTEQHPGPSATCHGPRSPVSAQPGSLGRCVSNGLGGPISSPVSSADLCPAADPSVSAPAHLLPRPHALLLPTVTPRQTPDLVLHSPRLEPRPDLSPAATSAWPGRPHGPAAVAEGTACAGPAPAPAPAPTPAPAPAGLQGSSRPSRCHSQLLLTVRVRLPVFPASSNPAVATFQNSSLSPTQILSKLWYLSLLTHFTRSSAITHTIFSDRTEDEY